MLGPLDSIPGITRLRAGLVFELVTESWDQRVILVPSRNFFTSPGWGAPTKV